MAEAAIKKVPTQAERQAQISAEVQESNSRILDFVRGAAKTATTDLPGLVLDVIDFISGDTKKFGEKDRSAQMFEKATGSKSTGSDAEKLGGFADPKSLLKAIIVPAFLTKSLRDVKQAEKYLSGGADPVKVEEVTGIFGVPGSANDGILRTVISDTDARLKESGIYRAQNVFGDPAGPSLMLGVTSGIVQKLPDVLDHPELFNLVPGLKDTRIVSEFGGFRSASYVPRYDVIRIGADSTPEGFMQTLLHEVQHAVQHKYGMNAGGNPMMFFDDPQAFKEAQKHLGEKAVGLDKLYAKYEDPTSREIIRARQYATNKSRRELSEAEDKARGSYFRIAGEREATAVEKMRAAGSEVKKPTIQYYGTDLDKLIADPLTQGFKQDSDPVIQAIINSALNEAARTNKKAP